ncbi:RagB/SusD family nutrient uptake outer membrane protein [Sphingobacterium pedocola]|nr:RagB/SusD family nutrient uptake outer membrane protein [Sphingobacterium pedocola]
MMKRYYLYIAMLFAMGVSSCGKEWLKVTPIDNLSGNNYWQTEEDVKMFVGGLYSGFRTATMQQAFFPGTGDLRCAPLNRNSGSNATGAFMNWLSFVRDNNLNGIFDQYTDPARNYEPNQDFFGFHQIRDWSHFYRVIAKANIAVYEIDNMEDGILSESKKNQYIAEAVFMRNLSYFFLVRLFGNVPYYTEAYHDKSIGRTPMLDVLQAIDADMTMYYKDLPWTQEDPTEVGNRAMRGGAIALMMHINMWLAGFSDANKTTFYERTVSLGREVIDENEGSYGLMPLKQTKEIFKGRTKEGLFEITQNYNYGETFHLSAMYADNVLRAPYKFETIKNSYIHYDLDFMEEMYPRDLADERKSTWFEEDNLYAQDGQFVVLKNVNIFREEGEDFNPDDNMIVFRYADVILLRAEALAEIGGAANETEATNLINLIRSRANAAPLAGEAGQELKDFIWWERVRELLGEGHFYYDLVRTKRVLNSEFCVPIPIDAFYRGAWTWPIDRKALVNNPSMTLNPYWN